MNTTKEIGNVSIKVHEGGKRPGIDKELLKGGSGVSDLVKPIPLRGPDSAQVMSFGSLGDVNQQPNAKHYRTGPAIGTVKTATSAGP